MNSFFSWQHAILKAPLESTTKHVCLTVGCHMAMDGTGCFPSYAHLAGETGLSRRCVIEHVQKAAAAGYLMVQARERPNGSATSNLYQPCMPGGDAGSPGGDAASLGGGDAGAPLLTPHPSNTSGNTPSVSPTTKEPNHGPNRGQRLDAYLTHACQQLGLSPGSIPEGFYQFAEGLGWDGAQIWNVFENFRDYWRAAAGANAVKRDWLAAWRIWCRREADRPQRGRSGQYPSKSAAVANAVLAESMERERLAGHHAGTDPGIVGCDEEGFKRDF